MNFTKKQSDELNVELTVHIDAADYAEAERKRLAEYRRHADFKGFRKGNVPASLIKKVYGGRALAEAVNEVLSDGISKFIDEEKLHVLGEPLPSETQPEVDWEDGKDFDFVFDLGLSPVVKVEVSPEDSVNQYTITSSAKDKEDMSEYFKKLHENRKEEKTDEEIAKEVEERLKSDHKAQSDWRLDRDIRDFYIKKSGVALPEAFLKRWLLHANEGKVTAEQVEQEFPAFIEDFKWQLVRGTLMKNFGFEVTSDELKAEAENYVRTQYAMYGLSDVPANLLDEAVRGMLQNQSQVDRLVEHVQDRKVLDKIKSEIKLTSKRISSEKFAELA